jgi:hypothetical protein
VFRFILKKLCHIHSKPLSIPPPPHPTCRYRATASTPPHITHGECLSRASPDTSILDSAWRCPWRVWYLLSACEEDTHGGAFIPTPLPSTHAAHVLGYCGWLELAPLSAKPAMAANLPPVICCPQCGVQAKKKSAWSLCVAMCVWRGAVLRTHLATFRP